MNSAEKCRQNDWGPGTRLLGHEGNHWDVIEITAVGEETVLAKVVETRGHSDIGRESSWTLDCRDWHQISSAARFTISQSRGELNDAD